MILTTQRIETCSRETAYIYERKITAILTIKYNKLKPLPENPRIERHGDFSFKEKFLIFIVYEENFNNIIAILHYGLRSLQTGGYYGAKVTEYWIWKYRCRRPGRSHCITEFSTDETP